MLCLWLRREFFVNCGNLVSQRVHNLVEQAGACDIASGEKGILYGSYKSLRLSWGLAMSLVQSL